MLPQQLPPAYPSASLLPLQPARQQLYGSSAVRTAGFQPAYPLPAPATTAPTPRPHAFAWLVGSEAVQWFIINGIKLSLAGKISPLASAIGGFTSSFTATLLTQKLVRQPLDAQKAFIDAMASSFPIGMQLPFTRR